LFIEKIKVYHSFSKFKLHPILFQEFGIGESINFFLKTTDLFIPGSHLNLKIQVTLKCRFICVVLNGAQFLYIRFSFESDLLALEIFSTLPASDGFPEGEIG